MVPTAIHQFLIKTATLLHRYGTPSHRLERVMAQVATTVGVSGVFLYTPTALVISITDESGESTYLRRVDSGDIDVDKLIRFDDALEHLEDGRLSIDQAEQQLDQIANAPPPYPGWLIAFAGAVSCAAVAVFLRGSPIDILASAAIGLLVALIGSLHTRLGWEHGFLEPVAGFASAVSALAIAKFLVPIDDRLVTLAGLILMIPGLKITVALTELAVGHLSSGVARLAGACVSLLTITVGVAIGWRIAGSWRTMPAVDELQIPNWTQWIAIVVAPITFAVVFKARWPVWPTIVSVSIAGFLASITCGRIWGLEVGAFCGAFCVGVGSNLYALRNRPALVPLTPGIIVLVPGSLGYRSLTAFVDRETIVGIDFAFSMLIVAMSLVGGILTANAFLPPRRIL